MTKLKEINRDWYGVCRTDDEIKILNRQLTTSTELFDGLRYIIERMKNEKDAGEWLFGDASHYEKVVFYEGYKRALNDLRRVLPEKEVDHDRQ